MLTNPQTYMNKLSWQQNSFLALTQLLSNSIKSAAIQTSVSETRKLHAHLISTGLSSSLFLQNSLLNSYFASGLDQDARALLGEITSPSVVSYNIVITGMSNSGLLDEARKVFDEMPIRDSVSWNSLMSGYFRNGMSEEAIEIFISMVGDPTCRPNVFTFTCAMKACGLLQCQELGNQLHGFVSKLGLGRDPQIDSSVVDMHIKCGSLELAARAFEMSANPNLFTRNSMILCYSRLHGVGRALETFYQIPERDIVSWNTLISILSRSGHVDETLFMAVEMFTKGYGLNSTTYSSVLSAVTSVHYLNWGRHLHAHILKFQQSIDVFVGSALVDLYAKCGRLEVATRTFKSLPEGNTNTVSWTALIGGFSQSGLVEEAIKLFNDMRSVKVGIDQFTLATVLSASYNKLDANLGTQLHCLSVKTGLILSVPVSNALLAMYSKCGNVEIAEAIFHSMDSRDVISWTSMITAYCQLGNIKKAREFFDNMTSRNVVTWNAILATYIQHGHGEEGLKMFVLMLKEDKVMPDWVTFVTLISACADTGSIRLGNQVIAHTIKHGLDSNTSLTNGVVTMYSKCGRIREARKLFDSIREKDLVSWNAMITAYAQHGQGREATEIFDNFLQNGIQPDYISYVAVLSGCSHTGLVAEGRHYFDSMTRVYKISPGIEHFACMVDLLGRAGFLQEAKEMIDSMPIKPSAEVWGALLGACKIHGDTGLAEYAAKHIFELNSKDPGSYVLLAKMYADGGQLDSSAEVRRLMREKGIKKNPGCSWIEVRNTVHVFTAEDVNHPQVNEVIKFLDEIMKKIEGLGYVKETAGSWSQSLHSEKLAVAFGLLSLPSCMPVYVMKNLRTCDDCHAVIKLISLVETRELVVRDAIRFHHFRRILFLPRLLVKTV